MSKCMILHNSKNKGPLTLAISYLVLLSQTCLYLSCLKKSTDEACVQRKVFIFKIAGVYSSLERSVRSQKVTNMFSWEAIGPSVHAKFLFSIGVFYQ